MAETGQFKVIAKDGSNYLGFMTSDEAFAYADNLPAGAVVHDGTAVIKRPEKDQGRGDRMGSKC